MQILIIAANFGNGHLSAARAIAEQCGPEDNCEILVPSNYKFTSPSSKFSQYFFNNVISKYTKGGIVKATYNINYNFARNVKLLFHLQKSDGSIRTQYLLRKKHPDVVIETFPHLIRNTRGSLRCCVVTDYTFAKVYIAENEGALYFVPSPSVKEEAIEKYKVSESQIFVTGIPVEPTFNQENKSTKCKNVLITLGARGQIGKKDIDTLIASAHQYDLNVRIICGKNQKIYEYLKERKNIDVFGFVTNMHEHVAWADLVITKSGGISISECICSETPILINIDQSMSGQEEKNQQYLLEHGLGLCKRIKNIDEGIKRFATDDDFYLNCVDNLRQAKRENYQHSIIQVLRQFVREE